MVEIPATAHPEVGFARQNEPIAIQARLIQDPAVALTISGPAMRLPDLNEADVVGLNNENKTKSRLAVSKAATKVTFDIHTRTTGSHQEKVDEWKDSFVQNYNHQTNNRYENALNNLKIGQGASQIDFSNINNDAAQKLYDRYCARDQTREQKVGKIAGKKVVLYDFDRFVGDVLDAHKNAAGAVDWNSLKTRIDGVRFVATLTFGREGAEFIAADLEKEIKLATNPKRFCEETNQKAGPVGGERSRQNRLDTVIYRKQLPNNSFQDVNERDLINWVFINGRFDVETIAAGTQQPPRQHPIPRQQPIITIFGEDLLQQPRQERLNNLPHETLRAAQGLCDNLRERMKNGKKTERINVSGTPMIKVHDPVTNIDMDVPSIDAVDNGWFHSTGFTNWAHENALPLFFLAPGDIHAQLLLKLDKDGYYFYDPTSNEGEQFRLYKNNITFENYLQEMVNKKEIRAEGVEISGRKYINYHDKNDAIMNNAELVNLWLNHIMPVPIYPNSFAFQLIVDKKYDLTLENDPDLPDHIKKGKIQRMQFDGKNCIPISFFHAALRYAAKPGNNEFKRTGIKKFQEDFGVRILTREEILK